MEANRPPFFVGTMGNITRHIVETIANDVHSILENISAGLLTSPTFYPALFGVVIALVSIHTQRRTSREKNSLDFEGSYNKSDTVNDAFEVLVKINQNRLTTRVDHWGKLENSMTEESKALKTIFNEWERCANAIRHNIYDDAYLYKIYGSTVLTLDTRFAPYIKECQHWNERVYKNFKWLALRWRIRRSYENDKPKVAEYKEALIEIERLKEILAKYEKR